MYLCAMLLLNLPHQRNRRRFVLSINSIDCCSTNCSVSMYPYRTYTVRTPSVSYVVLCSAACCCIRTSAALLGRMEDVNVCFSCVRSVFFLVTQKSHFLMHSLAVLSHQQPQVAHRYALGHYGQARSRRRASARRGKAPLVCI